MPPKDLARALVHLAALWRDWDDLETLAALPDGTVRIDVLRAESAFGNSKVTLRLAQALKDDLRERLARKGIAPGTVRAAELAIAIDTTAVRTDRARIVHFDFGFEARVENDGAQGHAVREERHVWHPRERD